MPWARTGHGTINWRRSAELLAPAPFDALYPHYLCARIDAALSETARYAGEQSQYNALAAELAVWLRQRYPPRAGARWRWWKEGPYL